MKEEKNLCHIKVCAFRCLTLRPQNLVGLKIKFVDITSFSNTMSLQREPFLILFYTIKLSPTRYQVRFYANNYFEQFPIVSTDYL